MPRVLLKTKTSILKKHIVAILLFLLANCQTAIKSEKASIDKTPDPALTNAPKNSHSNNALLLDHKYFIVSYNKEHRLPNWVKYSLLAKNLRTRGAIRCDKGNPQAFFADPYLVKNNIPYFGPNDLKGTGIHRGHMAPSGDFMWDQEANCETFVMSNIAPQSAELNSIAWNALEMKVRKWACTEEELTIYTGPVLSKEVRKTKWTASVPFMFYKVIFDNTPPRKMIGFVYNQSDDSAKILSARATSVENVESITGLTFFGDSHEEQKLKTFFQLADWKETNCIANKDGDAHKHIRKSTKLFHNKSDRFFECDDTKTCSDLNCTEAQFQLNECGNTKLDRDDDGTACDNDCAN